MPVFPAAYLLRSVPKPEAYFLSVEQCQGAITLCVLDKGDRQESFIGNQCGGRVFLFLQSNGFWHDYQAMKAQGVTFCEEPREEEYGLVVVFEDLYGNRWDLYQNR
ncbi:VOC family protein [Pantoea ananatis]|uniref:VOC family protein n=1 Tax=Pantoea ananas TaxID=553 RepID=UPI001FF0D9D3|nr:VOC family protein [Pantoea ananatis]